MQLGVPKEIKNHEYRVGMTPASVKELVCLGHSVMVETKAGAGIACSDEDYLQAGAKIVATAEEIFEKSELIVKVKEPQPQECKRLREGQTLFTYLHLAPDPKQTELLQQSGCTAIAYETVTDVQGGLPLLSPMSEVAGRMSIQAGASCLEKAKGGRGILLSGVPGVAPGRVVILGGGVAGSNAARLALGMGAQVTIFDKSLPRLRFLDQTFHGQVKCLYSTSEAIEQSIKQADLIVGAVLVPGGAAPQLVSRAQLKMMQPGSVLVDISIDQGGCFQTSRPTTHAEPTYVEDGIVHYCVSNMPGAVPRTSTFALNNATLPFVIELATYGIAEALTRDVHLRNGLNVHRGHLTHPAVAHAMNAPCVDPLTALKG